MTIKITICTDVYELINNVEKISYDNGNDLLR